MSYWLIFINLVESGKKKKKNKSQVEETVTAGKVFNHLHLTFYVSFLL